MKLQSTYEELKRALHIALEAGYRHIDTAYLYQNESIIGDVLNEWIQSGKIKREEIFITTKARHWWQYTEIEFDRIRYIFKLRFFFLFQLPPIGMAAGKVEQFLKLSLQKLKLEYVDLFLIHFPAGLISEDETDCFPVDENGQAAMDLTTDHVALWKVLYGFLSNQLCYTALASNTDKWKKRNAIMNCIIRAII